ncbi:aconitase family protein [Kribbella ginsengisoli]|uniref:Aconitate hydratase n=1 Tax=Kribbella ginsengisoli TaxID=363865 RepID=A0ABP6Z9M9_9ACTN
MLTQDTSVVAAQLGNGNRPRVEDLVNMPLLGNISTDEIIPGRCCYVYDERLGDYAYLGLRGKVVEEGAVRSFAPQIIVSGEAKGCGSSREHAVYAEKYAGVEIVFAKSFERIYEANCRNVGIITSDDFTLLDALLAGDEVTLEAFTLGRNDVEREVIHSGGLFSFNRSTGGRPTARRFDGLRPLNSVEKILQAHLSPRNELPNGASIRVGESYFVDVDVRFSHEYVTPMAAEMFLREFGAEAALAQPESCYFFQDHLSLAPSVLEGRSGGPALIERVELLNSRQEEFAAMAGGHFVGPAVAGGSRAICHNYIVENVALPGDIIIGTDSHTCTSGSVGSFAFGVGATDIANAWYNREVLVKIPPVIKINLQGQLQQGVCAKDLMLALLAHPEIQGTRTLGKVLLFTGPACATIEMDERATLCNMAVEAGATTAIFERDTITDRYVEGRGLDDRKADRSAGWSSDKEACYDAIVTIRLGQIEPMVALPGDPRNAVPLGAVQEPVLVDSVYGGSCTGGKAADMDMYASVFAKADERGLRVAEQVHAYIQMGSEAVMSYATSKGYVELFERVGVKVLPPSCGACINAGPGVSTKETEVTVSAQNRNFPGRSGPGQVYLASPYVVAATAIAGRLSSVEAMLGNEETP